MASSAIGGKRREQREFSEQQKMVGILEVEVIAINPDADAYEKLSGQAGPEDEEKNARYQKKFEYLGESKDGNATTRVAVYVKDVVSGQVFDISFFLEKKVQKNKDETKTQYINAVGMTTWTEDEDNLQEWFTKYDHREALAGEENLYNFLRSWLQIDFQDKEASLVLDSKKLFKGNFKELQSLVGSEFASILDKKTNQEIPSTVTVLATVKTKDVEDETKSFQAINNRHFLPGYAARNFKGKKFTATDAARIKAVLKGTDKDAKKKIKAFDRFIAAVLDEDYPVKEFFGGDVILEKIKDEEIEEERIETVFVTHLTSAVVYDVSKNPAASNDVLVGHTATTEETGTDDSDY